MVLPGMNMMREAFSFAEFAMNVRKQN